MLVQQANGPCLRVVVITRIGLANPDMREAGLIQKMPRQFGTRSRKIRPLDTVSAQSIANVDLRAKDESKKGACTKGEEDWHERKMDTLRQGFKSNP